MALGRKACRIADLEARNQLLVQQVSDAREEASSWHWARDRSEASRRTLRAAERKATADASAARAEADRLSDALLAEHGRAERYRAAWQSARRRAALSWQREGTLWSVGLADASRLELLNRRLDRALRACARYRADLAAATALEPARFQTCRRCGAGYELGQPCSTCAFNDRMAAEQAARTPEVTR